MNTEQGQALERLVLAYRERKAQIRADGSISWEQKERHIKELTDQHHRTCRWLEEEAAARLLGVRGTHAPQE